MVSLPLSLRSAQLTIVALICPSGNRHDDNLVADSSTFQLDLASMAADHSSCQDLHLERNKTAYCVDRPCGDENITTKRREAIEVIALETDTVLF